MVEVLVMNDLRASSPLLRELSTRLQNCLTNTWWGENVTEITPEFIAQRSYKELKDIPNMGAGSLKELSAWLTEHGQEHDWAHRVAPKPRIDAAPPLRAKVDEAVKHLMAAAQAFEEAQLPYKAQQIRDLALRAMRKGARK